MCSIKLITLKNMYVIGTLHGVYNYIATFWCARQKYIYCIVAELTKLI